MGMSGVKISGKVKWFNNAKGYGFINEEGKTEDLFAHYSEIKMDGYKTLKAGQTVSFEIIQGPKGLRAFHQAGEVVGDLLAGDGAFHRRDDQVGRFGPAHVAQHHLGRQDQEPGFT
jgi:CspA family cold shock protein